MRSEKRWFVARRVSDWRGRDTMVIAKMPCERKVMDDFVNPQLRKDYVKQCSDRKSSFVYSRYLKSLARTYLKVIYIICEIIEYIVH